MKLFKKIFILLLLPVLLVSSFAILIKSQNIPHLNPISGNNNYRQNLEKAFVLADIKPQKITHREFLNEVEFYLDDILIILSTRKDPFWQISSLQDILKIAKINHQVITFIDLSSAHPYATTL
ncbi:MAG: hypothetical protein WC841_01975 [Candidatus Shapirobacteria bacterium]|jgi:hypothetical protein